MSLSISPCLFQVILVAGAIWTLLLVVLHSTLDEMTMPRRFVALPLLDKHHAVAWPRIGRQRQQQQQREQQRHEDDDDEKEEDDEPTLRQVFEAKHDPHDMERIRKRVEALQQQQQQPLRQLTELPNCPTTTPPSSSSYPQTWPLVDLLQHWNPNEVNIPQPTAAVPHLYHSLCVLDWTVHSYQQIQAYRRAEIPFVLINHPQVLRTVERWNSNVTVPEKEKETAKSWGFSSFFQLHKDNNNKNTPPKMVEMPYLQALLRNEAPQRNEYAQHSNHLAFWRGNDMVNPPTQNVPLTMEEWFHRAHELERALAANTTTVTTSDHYYFRLAAAPDKLHTFLYEELPMFNVNNKKRNKHTALFMVEPDQERGINCRFGMVGSLADNHFDPTRNWILNLGGLRRYILSPPDQCRHLNLHPLQHPQGRHSKGNWGDSGEWPALSRARALQVVLQPGHALYLPTSWFHAIVSLTTTTFQCNARSGTTHTEGSELDQIFTDCGFPVAMPKN